MHMLDDLRAEYPELPFCWPSDGGRQTDSGSTDGSVSGFQINEDIMNFFLKKTTV